MSTLHVIFTVGDAQYVLPASDVLEMESYAGATRVPGTPPYVAGLVQVRGKVIPVVDLRRRFGLPDVERGLGARIVVVEHGERRVGLLADAAREVVQLAPSQFSAPPEVLKERAAGWVDAVAQAGDRLLMRLDFTKVIARDDLPEVGDGTQGQQPAAR